VSSGESGGNEVVGSVLGESSDEDEVNPRDHEVSLRANDVCPRVESTNERRGQEGALEGIQRGPILEESFSNNQIGSGQVANMGKG